MEGEADASRRSGVPVQDVDAGPDAPVPGMAVGDDPQPRPGQGGASQDRPQLRPAAARNERRAEGRRDPAHDLAPVARLDGEVGPRDETNRRTTSRSRLSIRWNGMKTVFSGRRESGGRRGPALPLDLELRLGPFDLADHGERPEGLASIVVNAAAASRSRVSAGGPAPQRRGAAVPLAGPGTCTPLRRRRAAARKTLSSGRLSR